MLGQFQAAEKLTADGTLGKATLTRLDQVLVKKAQLPPPTPPPVAPAPVSLDYMLGSADPALQPDAGAGPWNTRPTEASYVALKAAIIDILGPSVPLVGADAVAHMWHYQAQDFVETLPAGIHAITSRSAETGYNFKDENRNWYFGIGGYKRWGKGTAKINQSAQGARTYELDFTYKFYDRYNWDGGKSVTLFGIKITDYFVGEFHRQGLAREFDCVGAVRRRFSWKHGEEIANGQLSAPVVSERGA